MDGYRAGAIANYYFASWIGVGAGFQHYEQFSRFGDLETTVYQNRALATFNIGVPGPETLSF
ncbi:MAG: hypothetical protein M5R36_17360 [Deltaproteobacteria bacterium]|nr:hypothetical protein [Deltaproteobacteria bacterium]